MRTTGLALALVSALSGAAITAAEPRIEGTPQELTDYLPGVPGSVRLVGHGEVEVQADEATMILTIRTEEPSLQNAMQANCTTRDNIVRALKERGIGEKAIDTGKFASAPQFGASASRVKAYRVENTLEVTVTEDKQLQEVAAIVDMYRDIICEGVRFTHSKEDELKLQACALACDEVMRRKAAYEKGLGVRLTPKSFVETPALPEQVVAIRALGTASPDNSPAPLRPLPGRESGVGEYAAFGTITFAVQVSVEFMLQK
ncbi:MAG: SIMPL domain-containing protein [Kiritimatiellae bacterium]|nr:SIMPL domain-containing protein [Kiritimatiellia bacterium]